tara:strand:- start:252 stop:1190 length:939 start_codon:yes stop_codon:yes gene_type:complete
MGLGSSLVEILGPVLESIEPIIPGDYFPHFFTMELFQRSLIAAFLITIVASALGSFLLIRNLALIGDGLAHVSFGGVAVAIVLGATAPLWYALVFSMVAAIFIHEMQNRGMLTGDASIAIFLTGMLAFGLVVLRIWGGGITTDIEGYLFGNLLLIDDASLNLIVYITIFSLITMYFIHSALLATAIDPLAAQVQGIPVRGVGLLFSMITAAVVVSMVQLVGALLVTALLVTPAATAQLIANNFKACQIWTQIFGLSSVILGLFYSAELGTGTGSMIALVAFLIFALVAISKLTLVAISKLIVNYIVKNSQNH